MKYYIQNRGFCGDCLRWWKDGGHGYTSDLNKAWQVTREHGEKLCRPDGIDTLRLVSEADGCAEHHVNSENIPAGWRK